MRLLRLFGLRRKKDEGNWGCTTSLKHRGFVFDTEKQFFKVVPARIEKLFSPAKALINHAGRNPRLIELKPLQHYCGVVLFCSLALPFSRFYTRGLYDVMKPLRRSRVHLLHQAARGLRVWRALSSQLTTYSILRSAPMTTLHHDVFTEIWFGSTLGRDLRIGFDELYYVRDSWSSSVEIKAVMQLVLIAIKKILRFFAHRLHDHVTDILPYQKIKPWSIS